MEVSGIYDNGPISPVCKIDENIGARLNEKDYWYQAIYIEHVPHSSPFVLNLVALAGATTIAAGGNLAAQIVQALRMNDNEMMQLRWAPIDDVEGMLWQLTGLAKYNPRGGQAAVSIFTEEYDPWLASTTFFILGKDKDAAFGVFNPRGVAQPTARFKFFGIRYVLKPLTAKPANAVIVPCQGRVGE